MNKLLPILLICSITLTQELTIEGDLNVTGNIQNQTIDSLQQVIAQLESEIAILRANGINIYPKIFQLTFEGLFAYYTLDCNHHLHSGLNKHPAHYLRLQSPSQYHPQSNCSYNL